MRSTLISWAISLWVTLLTALAVMIVLLAFLMPRLAQAETLVTTVVDVIKPEAANEPWIFLLSSGRTLRVGSADHPRIAILKSAIENPRFLRIDFTDLGEIDRVDDLSELSPLQPTTHPDQPLMFEPEPPADSLLSPNTTEASGPNDVSEAMSMPIDFLIDGYQLTPQGLFDYFKSFRLRRGSQCFHRAYYWAHQLWRQTGAMSHKVFMFFSWKYIRKFNYNWWFHVAPFVYDSKGEEVVLDATFLSGPVSMRAWTNNFLRNDPECPVVTEFQGHSAHGRNDWCYLVKVPMWYYHPSRIEAATKTGSKVRTWDVNGIKWGRSTR